MSKSEQANPKHLGQCILLLSVFALHTSVEAIAQQPVHLTDEQDHQRTMDLLQITTLRPGRSGNPDAPNAANYDESKANPIPDLPDPLLLNNGKKVTSPKIWWNQRRPEIVEFFDREIYGRVPKNTPKVRWEVTATKHTTNGDIAVTTKTLAGHVDNGSYPLITIDIQLELTTPDNATGPVPVFMAFGFIGPFPHRPGAPAPPPPPPAQPGNSSYSRKAGATPLSSPAAFKPTTEPALPKASSASATKASLANSTTGEPSAPGPGEQAARSTTSKPTNPSTPGRSASKATPATAKPLSSPWPTTSASPSPTSVPPAKVARSSTAATGARSSRT